MSKKPKKDEHTEGLTIPTPDTPPAKGDFSEAIAASAETATSELRKPVERRRYKEKLPCKVEDPAQLTANANELAHVIHARLALKEDRRTVMAGYKDKFAHLDEREKTLADAVESKTESRMVECVEYLIQETGTVQVVRTDTGEVVESRGADASDLQDAIDFPAPEVEGEKAEASPPTDTNTEIINGEFEETGEHEADPTDIDARAVLGDDAQWAEGENPRPIAASP